MSLVIKTCFEREKPNILECDDFSDCSKSCGGGTKTCQNTCRFGQQPGIFGIHCSAEFETNIKNCNEHSCPEIIDCEISEECSKTCGGGVKTCARTCLNGSFGNGCDPALEFKSENCNQQKCPVLEKCSLADIECSVSCGSGTRICENSCENGQFGVDLECPEENRFTQENCNSGDCPEILECSNFSDCSKTCGGGSKRCERSCSHGGIWGVDCNENDKFNVVDCNDQSCPELQECEITEPCSASCGGGIRKCQNTCLFGIFGSGCDPDQEMVQNNYSKNLET